MRVQKYSGLPNHVDEATEMERDAASDEKSEFSHLFGAKLILRRLQQLNPTRQQLEAFDKLGRQYKSDVLTIREAAEIEQGDIKQRDKVYKLLTKTDLKGDAFWLQLQKDGGFTDAQRIGFRKTKARSNQFKSDAMSLLTEQQRAKWGSTSGRKRSSDKGTRQRLP